MKTRPIKYPYRPLIYLGFLVISLLSACGAPPTSDLTPTAMPVPTESPMPTATATPTEIPSATASATVAATASLPPIDTPMPTPSPTEEIATATLVPTETPVPTATPEPIVTPEPTVTPIRTATPTATPAPTVTPKPTATHTPQPPTNTPRPAISGNITITSIAYDGEKGRSEPDEYAVIKNTGSSAVNLAGWRLNAGAEGQDFYFPDYTMVPGEVCRVYTDENHPEYCGFSFGSGQALWANSGDCGYLYNNAGEEISSYCYD